MQNWHQNLDHWLAFDQSLQAHEKGEKGCHFHFVKSLDQFFLDWFSIARSSSWFWDGQLACQVLLSWKEEKEKLAKEAKHHEKPNSRLSLHQEYFSFFRYFSFSVFLYFSERRKTRPKVKRTIIFAGYFSSAHVEWYRISDQSGLAQIVFYISSPIVFRPRIVFALILHLFRTSLCFAVSPIIASWLLEMRTVLKSNFIQSALKCIYGCCILSENDCVKWQPIENLILFKAQQCWVSTGANRAMSLHWRTEQKGEVGRL